MNPKDTASPYWPRIHWISTGGTIAGCSNPKQKTAEAWGYQSAQLTANDLLENIPDVQCMANWSFEQPYSIGSQHLTPTHMVQLRQSLLDALKDPSVEAVLVTHGTDTLEDMLFFMYLTLPAERLNKPVVFTASMLPSDHPQADGPTNLRAAIQWALDCIKLQKEQGPIPPNALLGLVTQGCYTFAPWVRKRSTTGFGAFSSPHALPLPLAQVVLADLALPEHCPNLGQFSGFDPHAFVQAVVPVVYCTPNTSGLQQLENLHLLAEKGLRSLPTAIVIAAPGHGNIPDAYVPVLKKSLNAGMRVVRSSRVAEGGVQTGGEFNVLDSFKSSGLFSEAGGLSLAQSVVLLALQTKNPA